MGYQGVELRKSINIDKIYSIQYFEYMRDFAFRGESHDFWELICVDRGEVGIANESTFTVLNKGELAFHEPHEYHNITAVGETPPNLVVIAFQCQDKAMKFFKQRIFRIDEFERSLLADLIIEARESLGGCLENPAHLSQPQTASESFAPLQMIQVSLEYFLIHLRRRYSKPILVAKELSKGPMKATRSKGDAEIFQRVANYLAENLERHLSIDTICLDNLVGRTQLQKIFKEQCGQGIIEYFSHMKINAAKELIRSDSLNFTQIASQLGYSSIHYFSRQFKKIAGMTPTEYASSIKAMTDAK